MLALVNWGTFDSATGGTFQSDTDGTFHSDIPGTFESDMGGTFKVLQSIHTMMDACFIKIQEYYSNSTYSPDPSVYHHQYP